MKALGLEPPGKGIEISQKKGFHYTNHEITFTPAVEKA
jgi:hypothetical protein